MKGVDARRARSFFILADRQPEVSDAAFQQRAAKNKGQNGGRQQHVIEHHRVAAELPEIVTGVLRDREKQAGRRIGPSEMIEPDPCEFSERDGENGEVDAGNLKTEGQEADKGTRERREWNSHKQPDPGADSKMHKKRRRGIGAQPHIERMTERQLAGEAHHYVPGLAGIRKVQDQNQYGEHVVAREQWRDEKTGKEHTQQPQAARGDASRQPPDHAALLPMMPCGRKSSTRTRMAKANMLLADGVNTRPAIASVRPMRTPPTSAPGIEPRPPVITMTKASRV